VTTSPISQKKKNRLNLVNTWRKDRKKGIYKGKRVSHEDKKALRREKKSTPESFLMLQSSTKGKRLFIVFYFIRIIG